MCGGGGGGGEGVCGCVHKGANTCAYIYGKIRDLVCMLRGRVCECVCVCVGGMDIHAKPAIKYSWHVCTRQYSLHNNKKSLQSRYSSAPERSSASDVGLCDCA